MPPAWLTVLSWVVLAVGFPCAEWIVFDIYGRGYRQHMKVMEIVWPVTALYAGPLAVVAYSRFGKPKANRWLQNAIGTSLLTSRGWRPSPKG